jgi:hypothetical protein
MVVHPYLCLTAPSASSLQRVIRGLRFHFFSCICEADGF